MSILSYGDFIFGELNFCYTAIIFIYRFEVWKQYEGEKIMTEL